MGITNNEPPKSGFFSSIFSSKPKEEATTQEKTKSSALREFVKSSSSIVSSLFGRTKEIKPEPQSEPKRVPIDKHAISKQATHINAVKTSKMWAGENVALPQGTSANEVYALKDGSNRTATYFKRGQENEPAVGIMEELMWKTAVVLGDADQFVATSQTEIQTNTIPLPADKKVPEYRDPNAVNNIPNAEAEAPKDNELTPSEKGENPIATRQEKLKGGIQTAEASKTLADYIDNPAQAKFQAAIEVAASMIKYEADPSIKNKLSLNDLSSSNAQIFQDSRISSKQYKTMDVLFETCAKRGIDPLEIKKMCDNPRLSFEQIVKDIGDYIDTTHPQNTEIFKRPELLSDLYENDNITPKIDINRSDVIRASLTTMVYGMADCHSNNILVNNETHELKFFDNSRSMPSGNGYLDRGYGLVSSYRSGLMELEDSYKPLSSDEIDTLKEQLKEYTAKVNDLKNYYNSAEASFNIAKLPPGWIDKKASIKAMEVRIARLESALDTNQSINLRDLAMVMSPQYKFNAAMVIATGMIASENQTSLTNLSLSTVQNIQKNRLGSVGFKTMQELFEACAKKGIDPLEIKKLCDDPTKTFDEIVMDIGNYIAATPNSKNDDFNRFELLKDMYDESVLDLKDISRDEAVVQAYELALDNLTTGDLLQNCEIVLPKQDPKSTEVNKSPPVIYLRYEYLGKEQVHTIDYQTAPGKFIVQFGGKEMPPLTADEVKAWMESRALPKESAGFNQVISKLSELNIPLRATSTPEAQRHARALPVGGYFVAQEKGSSPPKLTLYQKDAQGRVDNFDLTFKYESSKLEFTLKMGKNEKSLSPETLKSLLEKK